MAEPEREFHALVSKVEERFRPVLDEQGIAKLGAVENAGGGSEGKYEPIMISTGWWVVLADFGVAICFGSSKPNIEAGETLALIARRIPKAPEAPAAASPPPITDDPRGALADVVRWWEGLPATLRQDIEGSGAVPGAIAKAKRLAKEQT